MNRREKILAIAVASMVAVGLLWTVVKSQIIDRRQELAKGIDTARNELDKTEGILSRKERDLARWRKLSARTLGTNVERVQTRLDSELKGLIAANNLAGKATVRPRTPRTTREGLTEMGFTVNATGRMQDVVNFLYGFYELPYLLKVRQLRLHPTGSAGSDEVGFEMQVATLILPQVQAKDIGSGDDEIERLNDLLQRVTTAPTDTTRRVKADRLAFGDEPGDYRVIVDRNIFATPPPPPKVVQRPRNRDQRRPPSRKPEPKPSNDPRDQLVITGVLSYPGTQEVLVRNRRKRHTERFERGEAMDNGRLILVHPLGAVVQSGSRQTFFYPLGRSFAERQMLDRKLHPDVFEAVEQMRQSTGS